MSWGCLRSAFVAGPPSPAYPSSPVPAIVEIFPSGPMKRTGCRTRRGRSSRRDRRRTRRGRAGSRRGPPSPVSGVAVPASRTFRRPAVDPVGRADVQPELVVVGDLVDLAQAGDEHAALPVRRSILTTRLSFRSATASPPLVIDCDGARLQDRNRARLRPWLRLSRVRAAADEKSSTIRRSTMRAENIQRIRTMQSGFVISATRRTTDRLAHGRRPNILLTGLDDCSTDRAADEARARSAVPRRHAAIRTLDDVHLHEPVTPTRLGRRDGVPAATLSDRLRELFDLGTRPATSRTRTTGARMWSRRPPPAGGRSIARRAPSCARAEAVAESSTCRCSRSRRSSRS